MVIYSDKDQGCNQWNDIQTLNSRCHGFKSITLTDAYSYKLLRNKHAKLSYNLNFFTIEKNTANVIYQYTVLRISHIYQIMKEKVIDKHWRKDTRHV